jgi:hypothetical protein
VLLDGKKPWWLRGDQPLEVGGPVLALEKEEEEKKGGGLSWHVRDVCLPGKAPGSPLTCKFEKEGGGLG